MSKTTCNLCDMSFDPDTWIWDLQKAKHERWHTNCKKEKRNTTEGHVEWIINGSLGRSV